MALPYNKNGTGCPVPFLSSILLIISSFMVYESLDLMGGFSALMRTVKIVVDQANEVLALPPMDIEGSDATPATMDIELKNVSFAYEDRKIIDNVSLKIPAMTFQNRFCGCP